MSLMKLLGYVAFFVVVVLLSLYWSFPWDAAKDRALAVASKESGMEIDADQVDPSWGTGIVARGVRIRTKPDAEPIELTELTVRAHVLPLLTGGRGVTFDLPIARGAVEASVVLSGDIVDIEAEATDLELALIDGLKEAIEIPLSGLVSLTADLQLGTKDPKKTEGQIDITGRKLEILKGGRISGFPIPELAVGNMDWSIPVEAGVAKLDNQEIKGENVEVVLDGEITLDKIPKRSRLNLSVRFKPTPAFLKREPLLNSLLGNIKRAKRPDGFYGYRLTGTFGRPRFRQGG